MLRAGFPADLVAGVVLMTRFDPGCPYLEHFRVAAVPTDRAAKRVAASGGPEPEERWSRRRKALEIMQRGLGC